MYAHIIIAGTSLVPRILRLIPRSERIIYTISPRWWVFLRIIAYIIIIHIYQYCSNILIPSFLPSKLIGLIKEKQTFFRNGPLYPSCTSWRMGIITIRTSCAFVCRPSRRMPGGSRSPTEKLYSIIDRRRRRRDR